MLLQSDKGTGFVDRIINWRRMDICSTRQVENLSKFTVLPAKFHLTTDMIKQSKYSFYNYILLDVSTHLK